MMSFPTAIKTCLSKFAEFSGRAPRAEYWWFLLFMVLVILAVDVIVAIAVDDSDDVIKVINWVIQIGFLLPSIAVSVRRLHDCDASGWHYLWMFVPFLGVIGLLIWFCFRGTPGDNRFGPDPLAPAVGNDVAEVFR
ncbi:MAG TPA: DUF805 domain-containing protein [Reyranella sp.]|nr:DUF805 domain-containing protein [Reyranella sp.]